MYIWSPNLYMDRRVAKKLKSYQKIVEQNKRLRSVYCITLPVLPDNNLEIYQSREFWFQYYRCKEITIVGLACDEESAYKLVSQICLDTMARFGDITPEILRDYFEQKVG